MPLAPSARCDLLISVNRDRQESAIIRHEFYDKTIKHTNIVPIRFIHVYLSANRRATPIKTWRFVLPVIAVGAPRAPNVE
jgi:hypothetical protein